MKQYSESVRECLTEETMSKAVRELCSRDADLARVREQFGPPPLWAREPGFPTLVLIILEQQVSLASARAAFDRLQQRISPVTPGRLLALDDAGMKAIGFSRQKTSYARHLAEAIAKRNFNPGALTEMEDAQARAALIELKGIGHWSADIYLMMALRRRDIWPVHDLALATAAQHVKRLRRRPSPQRLEALGRAWRPWRSVAARLLWHFYLSGGHRTRS